MSRPGRCHGALTPLPPPPETPSHDDGDLVDEETKQLSREEAEQHDGIVDAQEDEIDAEEGEDSDGGPAQGGYGH